LHVPSSFAKLVTMEATAWIAEQRIREAMEDGVFDDLPGYGRPLRLDDDAHVPEDLRLAFRILKNAGVLPPELELRQEIVTLGRLLDTAVDGPEKEDVRRRLRQAALRLAVMQRRL
jgi:hypothetical protein